MNLLHPTLGDLMDRLAILGLKVERDARFNAEFDDIKHVILERSDRLDRKKLREHAESLRRIHEQIWNINAKFAAQLAEDGFPPPNHLGIQAWALNQDRIKILEQIDTMSGEFTRPEKVY